MKRLTLGLAGIVAGLLIGPSLASAADAVTTAGTNLRAGPAFDFPVVDRIPSEVGVNIHGCIRAYSWCDVSWRDARGWVPGDQLAYLDNGRRVRVVEYGPRIGLPIVGFAVDSYWDTYYRGRPFYGQRDRWRTTWRDRDHDGRRTVDRDRDRRDGRSENRTDRREMNRTDRGRDDARREADRHQNDRNQQHVDRDRNDRAGRGEAHGYNPNNGATSPNVRTQRGSEGTRATDGGRAGGSGAGREDRKSN
jgi:uncharacterized protein YraI